MKLQRHQDMGSGSYVNKYIKKIKDTKSAYKNWESSNESKDSSAIGDLGREVVDEVKDKFDYYTHTNSQPYINSAKDNETMRSELKRVRDMEHEGIKDSGKKSKSSSDYTDYSEDTQASPYISDEDLLNLYDSVSDPTPNFSLESGYSLQFVDDNHDLQIIPITEDQYELIKAHLEEQMSSISLFENLF